MKNWPKVSIIILNWNKYEMSMVCIKSLEKITYANYDIIIVDNNSNDNSGEKLKKDLPNCKVILNTNNEGFARGANIGIRYALEKGADYALLLNNDSMIEEKLFLEPAIQVAESDNRIGVVSGKIYYQKNPKMIWYAGGYINLLRGQAIVRGLYEVDKGQFDKVSEVRFATGALLLIKREVLEKVGLLPEEYFFGYEEWDYSLMVRRAGYKLYYVPGFTCYHKSDGSHSNSDPKYIYNSYRNKLIFQQKYLPPIIWFFWKIFFMFYCKYIAKWRLKKVHGNKADIQDLLIALKTAIKDHKKEGIRILTEQDMLKFEAKLNKSK